MNFIINLIIDYKKGYRILIKKYKDFIYDFIFASIIIAMLNAELPYILRQIINEASLPEATIPNLLLLLGATYGIGWTIAEVLEWIKNIYSSRISTGINIDEI
ncbi:hypothetical protein NJ8700_06010 [Aggregatibacter aphrophilus NJ8700]|uniref:ABC transporter ATP-binding protein n=1 Tax=Aggregatibacter aphrophilus TaxID=732 RepID=UPI00022FEF1C|nr:ABC transporter ATP-binding protein [Aggregatibacter aphrophilus]AKS64973.1 hypothetical protein NJ8700_06010 [Aggregatibacter aphrophilus NJ8700]EHB91012.1 hypothetical protein HMPREF9335_00702 [Aggregatibacter aphrophilus F0387]